MLEMINCDNDYTVLYRTVECKNELEFNWFLKYAAILMVFISNCVNL